MKEEELEKYLNAEESLWSVPTSEDLTTIHNLLVKRDRKRRRSICLYFLIGIVSASVVWISFDQFNEFKEIDFVQNEKQEKNVKEALRCNSIYSNPIFVEGGNKGHLLEEKLPIINDSEKWIKQRSLATNKGRNNLGELLKGLGDKNIQSTYKENVEEINRHKFSRNKFLTKSRNIKNQTIQSKIELIQMNCSKEMKIELISRIDEALIQEIGLVQKRNIKRKNTFNLGINPFYQNEFYLKIKHAREWRKGVWLTGAVSIRNTLMPSNEKSILQKSYSFGLESTEYKINYLSSQSIGIDFGLEYKKGLFRLASSFEIQKVISVKSKEYKETYSDIEGVLIGNKKQWNYFGAVNKYQLFSNLSVGIQLSRRHEFGIKWTQSVRPVLDISSVLVHSKSANINFWNIWWGIQL